MNIKKRKVYTAWGRDGWPNTLFPGIKKPHYANGSLMTDCPERICQIRAYSFKQAIKQYDKLIEKMCSKK